MKNELTAIFVVALMAFGGISMASACEDSPVISYCRCLASHPENVAGFDTPMERAYVYQGMLNEKVELLDSLVQQRYQYRGRIAFITFYQAYYQDLQDKYQKMYCTVGNKVLGD